MQPSQTRTWKSLIQPGGRLEISRGLRAIAAFAVPLIAGKIFAGLEVGNYIGLAALYFVLGDVGGLYHTRVRTLIATILACIFSLFIGTLIPNLLWVEVLLTFIWLFGVGYISVYGHPGVMTGIIAGLFFLFALNLPSGDIELGIQRALIGFTGGIWAIILCLGMWPIKPYQPLRKSVARCYQAIAKYIESFGDYSNIQSGLEQAVHLKKSLQTAREALIINRIGRLGGSPLADGFVILIQDADRLSTSVVTLTEYIIHHNFPQFITVRLLINDALEELSTITQNIAKLILSKSATIDLGNLRRITQALAQQKQLQRNAIKKIEDYPSLVAVDRLVVILEKLTQTLESTIKIAEQIRTHHPQLQTSRTASAWGEAEVVLEAKKTSGFDLLRDNFTLDSAYFRHGLRLGLATAVGVAIFRLTETPMIFWVGLTVLLVLQPDIGSTTQRFFHRIIGTVLGAIFSTILLEMIDDVEILEALSVLSISIAFGLLRYHYAIAVFFISIFAMTLTTLDNPMSSWELASLRVWSTLLGAGLAFMAAFFLWRDREHQQLSESLVRAIEACLEYFQSVMAVYLETVEYNPQIIAHKRQQNRLAYCNAQAAFQRWSRDPKTKIDRIEPALTVIQYIYRFSQAVTVLMAQLEQFSGSEPHPQLATFVEQVEQILTQFSLSIKASNFLPNLFHLDMTYNQIIADLKTLQAKRLEEFAEQEEDTKTLQILRDYSIVGVQIRAISDYLKTIHSAILRYQNQ